MSAIREITSQFSLIQTAVMPSPKVVGATVAIVLGTFIIFAVGFAAPELIHNAAHDLRHGLAFPCH